MFLLRYIISGVVFTGIGLHATPRAATMAEARSGIIKAGYIVEEDAILARKGEADTHYGFWDIIAYVKAIESQEEAVKELNKRENLASEAIDERTQSRIVAFGQGGRLHPHAHHKLPERFRLRGGSCMAYIMQKTQIARGEVVEKWDANRVVAPDILYVPQGATHYIVAEEDGLYMHVPWTEEERNRDIDWQKSIPVEDIR